MAPPQVRVRLTAQNDTSPVITKVSSALEALRRNIQGTVAGYLGFQSVKAVFTGIVNATVRGEQATAKLNAVLKATGNAAGMTARQITELSDSLAQQSLFDDEAIRDASAVLATFRNVAGQSFRDAMTAAVDLSTVMGQDLQSSVVQIGKALNDPVKGITALQKIGVTFTATQRTQIRQFVEAGQVMQAQKVILKELAAEFGGAGVASASTGLSGAIHRAKMALDDFLEGLGRTPRAQGFLTNFLKGATKLFHALTPDIEDQLRTQAAALSTRAQQIYREIQLHPTPSIGISQGYIDNLKRSHSLVIAQLDHTLNEIRKRTSSEGASPLSGAPDLAARTEAQEQSIRKIIDALRDEGAAIGASAAELQAYRLRAEGATEKEIELAESIRRRNQAMKALDDAGQRSSDQPQSTHKPFIPIKGDIVAPNGGMTSKKSATQYVNEAMTDFLTAMEEARQQMASSIADTLGDGIANGFAAALSRGSIEEGFKALTQTLLAGLGSAMVEFGKAALIASTLMQKIKASLSSLSPIGGVAASLAMIAIGGMLGGAAASAFGGESSSGYSARGLSDTVTRVYLQPSALTASASQIKPTEMRIFAPTVIGPNDPIAMRALSELMNNADSRGLLKFSGNG